MSQIFLLRYVSIVFINLIRNCDFFILNGFWDQFLQFSFWGEILFFKKALAENVKVMLLQFLMSHSRSLIILYC